MSVLKIKKLKENAKIPMRATEGSAGMDLYACIGEPVLIAPHEIQLIPTGIAIALESPDYVAYIYARSGLAIKYGIAPANCVGVIDSDYRGELCVALLNLGEQPISITGKMRIAQLALLPVAQAALDLRPSLDSTQRGAGGFGSTGLAPLEPEGASSGRKGGL